MAGNPLMIVRAPDAPTLNPSPSDGDAKMPCPPAAGHIAMMPPRTPFATTSQCSPPVFTPIGTFAASGDNDRFVLYGWKNLVHVGVRQSVDARSPALAVVIAHKHSANFDGGVKPAGLVMIRGYKPRARS
jgi:hypothetical protein